MVFVTTRTSTVIVFGEQRHPREGFAAGRARVLLHIGMGLQMGTQIRLIGEGAMTILATERFVAGVGANVSLQQPWPREGLTAQMTLARLGVGANVHLEGAQRCVRLWAVGAVERFLCLIVAGRRAMELLVLGQSGICGV